MKAIIDVQLVYTPLDLSLHQFLQVLFTGISMYLYQNFKYLQHNDVIP